MLRFADHGSQAASHGLSLLPAASGFHLLLFALLAQDGFARQADLVVLDGEDFDEDLAAQLQRVAQTMLGDFVDMQRADGSLAVSFTRGLSRIESK